MEIDSRRDRQDSSSSSSDEEEVSMATLRAIKSKAMEFCNAEGKNWDSLEISDIKLFRERAKVALGF
jgi:hypothetical protein